MTEPSTILKTPLVTEARPQPGRAWPRARHKPLLLAGVLAAHGLLLGVICTRPAPVPVVTTPTVTGVLIAPEPLPVTARPEPPKPVPPPPPRQEPRPLPPVPKAPPSERAVSAPPAPPVTAPAPAEPLPPSEPVAAPAPAPVKAEPEPVVTPPRSDASHLNNPAPVYPAMSRRLRESGRVLLDVYILANGQVGEIKLKQSSGFKRLDDAALQAVKSWKYVPARRGNDAIPFWYVQPLSFSLTE